MAASRHPYKLTELRKARHLSQKQASADLGISQALLSHYEKGIREPGLDFVIKAADYYGVSCDYLLGHETPPTVFNRNETFEDSEEDKDLTESTVIRAAMAIAAEIEKDSPVADYYFEILCGAVYMFLFASVKSGEAPREWLGSNSDNTLQLKFLSDMLTTEIDQVPDFEGAGPEREKVPACVETLTEYINDYINVKIAELM